MASVNKVILLGNLGKDPEVRYMQNGNAVCNLRIATTRSWKDKATGDKVEETEWSSVVLYDRRAEIAGEYLRKGSPVYIEGYLKTRKWQDKDGNDKYTTEIVADDMKLLGGRDGGGGDSQQQTRGAARDSGQTRGAPARGRQERAPQAGGGGGSKSAFDNMDDDVPWLTMDLSDGGRSRSRARARRGV